MAKDSWDGFDVANLKPMAFLRDMLEPRFIARLLPKKELSPIQSNDWGLEFPEGGDDVLVIPFLILFPTAFPCHLTGSR
ncbi:MAG: hypothetical protein J6038_04985 [Bacilli bacterium]|nr:hypothetical protein [Bacilli bacterium]